MLSLLRNYCVIFAKNVDASYGAVKRYLESI